MTLYQKFITEPTAAALAALYAENENANQTTPEKDLDVLTGLLIASRARRILQFGTFLGGSALVMADLARQAADDGKVITVDPNPAMNASCRKYAVQAGLLNIECIDGFSTDPKLLSHLSTYEWDAVYLDTTHQFSQTLAEITAIVPLCADHTLFMFHDASRYAADTLDMLHQGGVRRALREWCLVHPRWHYFVFEEAPFGQYGIGLMQKKGAP